MSNLFNIDVSFDCDVFCETGIGNFETIPQLINNNIFREYYTCDTNLDLIRGVQKNYDQVKVIHKHSPDAISDMIDIIGEDKSIMWWLDAHDTAVNGWGNDSGRQWMPLVDELTIIFDKRYHLNSDIIICDDYAYYDVNLQTEILIDKNIPWFSSDTYKNINQELEMLLDKWCKNYDIQKSPVRKGYLMVTRRV